VSPWLDKLNEVVARAGLSVNRPTAAALALILVGAAAFGAYRCAARPQADPDGFEVTTARTESTAPPSEPTADDPDFQTRAEESSATLFVHVVGAVRHPGVYELTQGARVQEAVESAGGCLESAAPQGLNLARPVADGEQVVVPTLDEWERALETAAPGTGADLNVSPGQVAGPGTGLIDLNSADAAALETLPGIGPATAAKIVADREANGPFQSVDDLARVSGIGPKKIEALRDLVTVR